MCTIEAFRGGSQRTPVATRAFSGYPFGYHYQGIEPIQKPKRSTQLIVPGVPPVPTTFQQKCEAFVDGASVPIPMFLVAALLILLLVYVQRNGRF